MSDAIVVVAIVGLPGSGKSVAADFFHLQGYTVLRFGDQTDIGLRQLGLEINESNERMYREQIRRELGMAAMAIKISPRITAALKTNHKIVLDGMKGLAEYEYLKKEFPHLTVLCIYASPKIRHERLAMRQIRPLTAEESRKRDRAELTALDTGGSMALADYLIKNEGTEKEFVAALRRYISYIS